MRFTKKPTPAQVRQGLALFAMAADYAREAKKARQAHAIKAGEAITRPDMAAEGQEKTNATEKARGSIGRTARGDEEPRRSGAFRPPKTTTGGPNHG